MTDEAKLKELRGRIDSVDEKLLSLLRERAAIIEEVRAVKGKQNIYIRPGREASMLRALVNAPQGHIPNGLVHRLWREMIGAFTLQEGAMRVACAPPKGEEGFWDLARDHFGSFTPMQAFENGGAALRAVLGKTCSLAALPLPQEGDGDVWWRHLLLNDAGVPNVFYAFPFDGVRGNARALQRGGIALGALQPEQTGADKTVLVVEWGRVPEKNEFQKIIKALGARRHVFATAAHEPACSWLELEGFLDAAHPPLKHWLDTHKALILRARVVGAFPIPLKDVMAG